MNARQLLDLLCEGFSTPVLFHATNVTVVSRMLDSGTLELTFSGGTASDNLHDQGKHFYLSCSRNPVNGYSSGYKGAAMMVLDAAKLRQRYEIVPVDYWQRMDGAADEQEDRLWASKPSIPLLPYLKEIHAVLDPAEDRPAVLLAYKAIAAAGIPHFFYQNPKDFQLLDRRKAVPLPDLQIPGDYEPYQRSDRWAKDLEEIVGFLENPLDPAYDDFYHKRAHRYDWFRSVASDVHNARSDKGPVMQGVLGRLSRLLRKRGVKSTTELVKLAQEEREKGQPS